MSNLLILKMEAACTSETTATQPTATGCKDPRAESISAVKQYRRLEPANIHISFSRVILMAISY
jgi:hypothetical protein